MAWVGVFIIGHLNAGEAEADAALAQHLCDGCVAVALQVVVVTRGHLCSMRAGLVPPVNARHLDGNIHLRNKFVTTPLQSPGEEHVPHSRWVIGMRRSI